MDRYKPPLAKLYDLFEKYAETEHFVSLTGTDAISSDGHGFHPKLEANVSRSGYGNLKELEDLASIARLAGFEPFVSVRGNAVILVIDPSPSGQAAANRPSYVFASDGD